MAHVFISYSHHDRNVALLVDGRLAKRQLSTFLDVDEVRTSDPFRTVILDNLNSATVLVVLCSTVAMASQEVLFEVAYSIGRGTPIFPLLIERNCRLPDFLRNLQYLDFSDPDHQPFDGLVRDLMALTERSGKLEDRIQEVGLVDIGKGRPETDRSSYMLQVLRSVKRGSTLLLVGRSLTDWALLSQAIEDNIREKNIRVRIALLDFHSLSSRGQQNAGRTSWIEKPIPSDWAVDDLLLSMERFRKIKVRPNTGSLEIYGLPFYPSHSFVAYTGDDDRRYCFQEAGMASPKGKRPYIECCAPPQGAPDSYASVLEWMNDSLLTPDRLLIMNDGNPGEERNTTHRGKLLANKVQELGLVDLAARRSGREWLHGSIGDYIDQTPFGGEIFLVGRSLVAWGTYYMHLAEAVIKRRVKCTIVMADPTMRGLQSLVKGDYAEEDTLATFQHFRHMSNLISRSAGSTTGFFELYGIPAYLPVTFASYTGPENKRYCNLEVGIGVNPEQRPGLDFLNVSDKDIYTSLNLIYRKIIEGREPLLRAPGESAKEDLPERRLKQDL